MKKKLSIGLVTYHFSDNFGAALQAYALRAWLRQQGHDAEFVNYCPDYVEHGGAFIAGFSRKALRANLKIGYLQVSALRRRLFGNRAQRQGFARFRAQDLGVTGPAYKDAAALHAARPVHDLLVCGSDQIWSPSVQRGLDEIYFLGFGAPGTRRISYAPSFGSATLASLQAEGAAALLRPLDAISVREESGATFVRSLTGRETTLVMDPTFLLENYSPLLADSDAAAPAGGHVFCYALRTDEGVREAATSVSALHGCPILAPQNPHSRWRPLGLTAYPCPRQWLSLLASSRFVVTNSFHGTVFSILLERPFVTVGLPLKRGGLNDRMISLLTRLDLMDRFLPAASAGEADRLARVPIDWAAVRQKTSPLREASMNFLREQLHAASGS